MKKMAQSGYNINDLVQEAQHRWLKPAEVLFILQNYENHQLTHEPPQKPASGSLFLFNKRVLRFFRKDGHSWRRKKDGRTVGEAHERLKVGNVEALNCYYAHGEQNPNFQRRSYWILDLAHEHIVLVHYRDIIELQGRHNAGSISQLSPDFSSSFSPSPISFTSDHPGCTAIMSEYPEPSPYLSSPGSVEVSSDVAITSNEMNCLELMERTREVNNSSSEQEFNEALRRLEEQLSLNDDNLKDIDPFYSENENSNDAEYMVQVQVYNRSPGMQEDSINIALQEYLGESKGHYHQPLGDGFSVEHEATSSRTETLANCKSSAGVDSQVKHAYTLDPNGMLLPPSTRAVEEELENHHWLTSGFHNIQKSINTYGTNPDYYTTLFDQGQIEVPLEADASLTIAHKQKFKIRDICPEWGYASETTKVIIIGSFLCDPSDSPWTCMLGNIEIPLQIIQEGVICFQAPPHLPGKVTLFITSGNQESYSEIREFEYRNKPSSCEHSNFPGTDDSKSPEELLLLVRFVQMLLSDLTMQKGESAGLGTDLFGKFKDSEDPWGQIIEAILVGTWTTSRTTDWLLQELLKDKLTQWLSSRSQEGSDQPICSLSKKEQGMIHMIAGLDFEWALNLILNSGVSINFRDINGWTALHWAARFGREKMVAGLIASGASAWALTDPNSEDSTGKTPASIAATCGHKGLAGYLSEVELTSRLSSLMVEESELSKGSVDVEAEKTINRISKRSLITNEDQLSLKDTLAAVRNAAQAAARIQSAFRAHSFRRRQEREASAAADGIGDEYCILSNDAKGLSAASKLAFRHVREYNAAALSIQKKYRGWKGRKDFLAFRQKVVKIQAHVRGHQVRKHYKVICWAVSVLEKVVLRWRRKGVGLRGFRQESEYIIDSEEGEDILKVFRKHKRDVAIDGAVSRVLSMAESQEARQQYRRMLERYRQAKAERGGMESSATWTSQPDTSNIDNDD